MIRRLAICIMLVSACGCYESEFPIASSENSTIDDDLIGEWVARSKNGGDDTSSDDYINLIIRELNDHE